jgi:hypothetical protein
MTVHPRQRHSCRSDRVSACQRILNAAWSRFMCERASCMSYHSGVNVTKKVGRPEGKEPGGGGGRRARTPARLGERRSVRRAMSRRDHDSVAGGNHSRCGMGWAPRAPWVNEGVPFPNQVLRPLHAQTKAINTVEDARDEHESLRRSTTARVIRYRAPETTAEKRPHSPPIQ